MPGRPGKAHRPACCDVEAGPSDSRLRSTCPVVQTVHTDGSGEGSEGHRVHPCHGDTRDNCTANPQRGRPVPPPPPWRLPTHQHAETHISSWLRTPAWRLSNWHRSGQLSTPWEGELHEPEALHGPEAVDRCRCTQPGRVAPWGRRRGSAGFQVLPGLEILPIPINHLILMNKKTIILKDGQEQFQTHKPQKYLW